VELVADAHTRAAVAKAAGLPALPRLEATFDLARSGRNGMRVLGRVSATVSQTCVVTLEQVENLVEEDIDLLFQPAPAHAPVAEGHVNEMEVPAEDEPETMTGGMVDLGALAIEFLILGLDPYPRKPGAVFEPPPSGEDGAHPFAALAALRKRSPPR
jgi:hypothetical protein